MPPDNKNYDTQNLKHESNEPDTLPVTPLEPVGFGLPQQTTPSKGKRMIFMSALVAVLLIAIGGYLLYGNSTKDQNTNESANIENTDSSKAMISITDTGVTPVSASIKKGGSVTWTNDDTSDHSLEFTGQEDLNSDPLKPNDSFTLTFDDPGVYNYSDPTNNAITGTIVVE